jgi:hypothetical protein
MFTDAHFSNDRTYRYWLIRIWDGTLPINCSCGLNPSTADEYKNDPTVRKDIGFSERQGFGGLLKLNLSAYRSTDPKGMRDKPIGRKNTAAHLRQYFEEFYAAQFIAAWGCNGRYLGDQARAVLAEFPEAVCFGRNLDGTPRHTLMLPYTTELVGY